MAILIFGPGLNVPRLTRGMRRAVWISLTAPDEWETFPRQSVQISHCPSHATFPLSFWLCFGPRVLLSFYSKILTVVLDIPSVMAHSRCWQNRDDLVGSSNIFFEDILRKLKFNIKIVVVFMPLMIFVESIESFLLVSLTYPSPIPFCRVTRGPH